MRGGGAHFSPLQILSVSPHGAPNLDVTGRTVVSTQDRSVRTLPILICSQSEHANYVNATRTPAAGVLNINPDNGHVYTAAEPLLGCEGTGGSICDDIAAALISGGTCDRVPLLPCGFNSATIADWRKGGVLNKYLRTCCYRMRMAYGTKGIMLFAVGTSDSAIGTDPAVFQAGANEVFATARESGFTGPIFVSRTTLSSFVPAGYAPIRTAQAAVVDGISIISGPDTDTLDTSKRYDGTHPNSTGAADWGALWATPIAAYVTAHPAVLV